jgi:anti-anti-sigma factor
MKFSLDKRERFCIFQIDDDKLLSNHAPELKSELLNLAKDEYKNIILDLSHVQFVDSSGLSALLSRQPLGERKRWHFCTYQFESPHPKISKDFSTRVYSYHYPNTIGSD